MRKSEKPPIRASDQDSDALRLDLQKRLARPVSAHEIADVIKKFIASRNKFDRKLLPDELARQLIKILPTAGSAELERLIARRPQELDNILWLSLHDDVREMLSFHGGFPRKKKTRTKNPTDAQRRKNIRASKAAHDRERTNTYTGALGLIEQQFSTPIIFPLSWFFPLPDPPRPCGDCLDKILLGETVRMAIGWDCLESLFGMARHQLPRSITRDGKGRYGHRGVLHCMDALLSARPRRWLPDLERRVLVLNGLIERANEIKAPAKIQRALTKTLLPHLS